MALILLIVQCLFVEERCNNGRGTDKQGQAQFSPLVLRADSLAWWCRRLPGVGRTFAALYAIPNRAMQCARMVQRRSRSAI
jgi:hypothetical protein